MKEFKVPSGYKVLWVCPGKASSGRYTLVNVVTSKVINETKTQKAMHQFLETFK